jgi:hypothetical protein
MKNFKKILLALPEYFLIAAVLFYWMSAGVVVNYFAIILIALLTLQIIFKFKVLELVISGILILTSMYMILALMSEFHEFPEFNAEAKELLFVGLAYFLSTIAVSGLMIYKYAKPTAVRNEKLELS